MRFSVFYLSNPTLGTLLNDTTHKHITNWFHAEDAMTAFENLRSDTISDNMACRITDAGLRRFDPVPGDILVSEEGDVICKTREGLETLAPSVHTLRLLRKAEAVTTPGGKRHVERSSFSTLKAAYIDAATDDGFPPEQDLPF